MNLIHPTHHLYCIRYGSLSRTAHPTHSTERAAIGSPAVRSEEYITYTGNDLTTYPRTPLSLDDTELILGIDD